MVKSILVLISVAIAVLTIPLDYYLLGYIPSIRARALKAEEMEAIKKYGISHKTTENGKKSILESKVVNGSSGRVAYSAHFKKTSFFFATKYMAQGESFHFNPKHRFVIYITNLSDEQLKNFKIRSFDKTLLFPGDFVIDEINRIETEELEACTWKQHILSCSKVRDLHKKPLFFGWQFVCLIISCLIFMVLFDFLYSIFM